MPIEFLLFFNNHALQYIMQQPKLNLKHVKWVEFLHRFTFLVLILSLRKLRGFLLYGFPEENYLCLLSLVMYLLFSQ